MVQTAKAQQNQENQKESQEQNQAPSMEALTKLLAPLTETVAQLKADKEQVIAEKAATQEAARQAQLDKDADISGMLDDVNVSDDGDDKYEKMSKRQMVEVIAGAVETALEASAVKIKNDIGQSAAEGNKKVDKIENAVMSILGHMGAQETRSKHDDFDDYAEDMSKIMGNVAGLSFDDAYLLAKSKRAGNVAKKSQIDSEKPTDTAWSPNGAQGGALPTQTALQTMADRGKDARENAAATESGTVGFRNILKAGMDRAIDEQR